MKLLFICPSENEIFESCSFTILDNKGITTDTAGNRVLNAKVALNEPCPHCGQKHVFHASELPCPFRK